MTPRDDARRILDAAVAAADPRALVARALGPGGDAATELADAERVFLVGAGKAAIGMARGALDAIGSVAGTLTVPHGGGAELPGVDVWEAGHPVPDTGGLAGAVDALRVARSAGERDVVLCLLSGGASALWPAPPVGVGLTELRAVTSALLRAGASIGEINTVRKHLSRIAGGGMARAAHPARLVALVLSDVVGSPLDVIASGPTVADPTTYADAAETLRRHSIHAPDAVWKHLARGAAGEVAETPKPGDPVFTRASTHLVGSVRDALAGAAREAGVLGYRARVLADDMEGEAVDVARSLAARVRAENRDGAPLALLLGGETTVTVRGDGVGGRNQELALALAVELAGEDGIVAGALGTDGVDGPTPAAGAVVDGWTTARGAERGLDAREALRRNDSHTFLRATGDLVVTGPTGTNVADVVVVLVA
ncbi:MAG TPA: DUF4147 domain-containing protein [Longimicrobium sp.]